MRCKHGVVGGCMACDHERWQAANAVRTSDAVAEIGRLVVELADSRGIDTSRLVEMLSMLKKAGLR
jgi:hypothetical protein